MNPRYNAGVGAERTNELRAMAEADLARLCDHTRARREAERLAERRAFMARRGSVKAMAVPGPQPHLVGEQGPELPYDPATANTLLGVPPPPPDDNDEPED